MTQAMLDERCALMRERTAGLIAMQCSQLSTEWIQNFRIEQLADCCTRIAEAFKEPHTFSHPIQRELIQNPAFARFLADILQSLPDSASPESPSANTSIVQQPPPRGSKLSQLNTQLTALLGACQTHGCCITDYGLQDVLDVLKVDELSGEESLIFLKNFAPLRLPPETRRLVVHNLRRCPNVPIDLNPYEKTLLQENFVATRDIFAASPFRDVSAFFDDNPVLLEGVRFLHQKSIPDCLGLGNYKRLSTNASEYLRLIKSLAEKLDADALGQVLSHWSHSECSMHELQRAERQFAQHPELDYGSVLETYSGYVNLLYGICFKTIDLSQAPYYQQSILTYAITHGKKHFIQLVDANEELFLRLPRNSLLFVEELYCRHLNINELTEANLNDLMWMTAQRLPVPGLAPGRVYTFQELKALYDTPKEYIQLYHLLSSGDLDYRLLVLRQLKKRKVLQTESDEELAALASRLDKKPLYSWLQQDFGHIADLDVETCVRMLIHLEKLQHLIPTLRNRTDAALALCNLSALGQFSAIEDLKSNIVQIDEDWRRLSETMNVSSQFAQQYQESIMAFLCRNGASIANTYLQQLEDRQKDAFLRIVKAELMGQFHKLKYYDGDLQKELDHPIQESVEALWKRNTYRGTQALIVQEHDDFFSTMLVGVQPQRTCLSYLNGVYLSCLLSSFDSNKKILYALQNGRIVGRAFLRLTKGRLGGPEKDDGTGFTFADVEKASEPHSDEQGHHEELVMFLEHPYFAGVNPQDQTDICQAFIGLSMAKADEMGIMLVLSGDYRNFDTTGFTWTLFNIYISKSKAGSQYLDSLGGAAEISDAGHYRTNCFFVRRPPHLQPGPTVQP